MGKSTMTILPGKPNLVKVQRLQDSGQSMRHIICRLNYPRKHFYLSMLLIST
uniref:Uncharacterized protein n=1 Tax=Rhizophora mucronata TaxID=61149 RepID=A0A2P2NA31_RHIMU